MIDQTKITFVKVAIFSKDREGLAYGVGAELSKKVNDNARPEPYAIVSLYLPKTEFPSVRSVFSRLFSEVFKLVPDDDQLIEFIGTTPYFHCSVEEMKRKAGVFANGRYTNFYRIRTSPYDAVMLGIDAIERHESLSMKL